MPTTKFDLIQRFEVENGVPRLVSTNIQVLEGGEDLMSLATSMLAELGCNEVFEQNRTSQYIGYRLKNAGKGAKRYQLVLAQRKESLYISLPKDIFNKYLLTLVFLTEDVITDKGNEKTQSQLKLFWVRPSKEDVFFEISNSYNKLLNGESVGIFELNEIEGNYEEYLDILSKSDCCLNISEDTLFPYTWQISISSSEVLKEFISSGLLEKMYYDNILF